MELIMRRHLTSPTFPKRRRPAFTLVELPAVSKRKHRAFTLVELLVVIAIITTMMSMMLPAVQSAREAARRMQCGNNLKQIGLAMQLYHEAMRRFPTGRNRADQYAVSWAFYLFPYIEEQTLYRQYDRDKPVDDMANAQAMRTPVGIYACPSRRFPAADRNFDNNGQPPLVLGRATLGDYAGNAGYYWDNGITEEGEVEGEIQFGPPEMNTTGPLFSGSKIGAHQIMDGMSHTIVVGERHLPRVQEGTPIEMEHYEQGDTCFIAGDMPQTIFAGTEYGLAQGLHDPERGLFGSQHVGLVTFAFLDGHVSVISDLIEPNALMALSTIAGEESVREQP